jgi:hypothetical protein
VAVPDWKTMSLDPVSALLDIGGKVIDRIWPDPTAAAAAKLELFKLQQSGELQQIAGQLAINQEEAKSASIFVSGWRPFIGWVCGAALVYTYLAYPLLLWAGAAWFPHLMPPKLGNDGMLYELLLGMLGLGGLRTFEKVKGVA